MHTLLPFTHSWTPRCPSELAYSSEDKNSWHPACWDLIDEAHFTLSKPGLIHPGAPTDTNLSLSSLFLGLCFLFFLILKRKKTLDKTCSGGEGRIMFVPHTSSCCRFNFRFQGSAGILMGSSLCFLPSTSSPRVIPHICQPTRFYSNTILKPTLKPEVRRCRNNHCITNPHLLTR